MFPFLLFLAYRSFVATDIDEVAVGHAQRNVDLNCYGIGSAAINNSTNNINPSSDTNKDKPQRPKIEVRLVTDPSKILVGVVKPEER